MGHGAWGRDQAARAKAGGTGRARSATASGAVLWRVVGRTPTSLTAALARDVPLYIRSRAEKYIRSGRAAVIEWADARIAFQVQGSDRYLVALVREEDAIVVSCTCPYFVDRGPCKHVWAAAVLVDQDPRWDGSWLQGDPLIDFESGIDDPDYDADVIDAGETRSSCRSARAHEACGCPRPVGAAAPRKPRKQPDPVTEAAQAAVNRLAELRQQLLSRPGVAGGAPSQLRPIPPPGAQLIFILDAASTKATGMLMVHAATRKPAAEEDGEAWSAAKPLALTPADVVRVADKADRDLVALLTSAAQSAYYGGYQSYAGYAAASGGGPFGYRHQPLAIPRPSTRRSSRRCAIRAAPSLLGGPAGGVSQARLGRAAVDVPDGDRARPEAPYPAYMLTGAFVRG